MVKGTGNVDGLVIESMTVALALAIQCVPLLVYPEGQARRQAVLR